MYFGMQSNYECGAFHGSTMLDAQFFRKFSKLSDWVFLSLIIYLGMLHEVCYTFSQVYAAKSAGKQLRPWHAKYNFFSTPGAV